MLEPGWPAIPKDHTIEMEAGTTIGGSVNARDGKSVPGASVSITARAGADNSPDWSYVPEVKLTTDSQGRWLYDEMPSGWSYLYMKVAHPEFVPTYMLPDFPMPGAFMLKAKKAEIILDVGVSLEGRVLDEDGRSLVGARIGLGADRRVRQREYPSDTTDVEGRFRFSHVPAGTQTLTAQAPGRAPKLADVVVQEGMKPVEFRLAPGHVIRGRLVDPKGKPLDGVNVQAMNWKGHSSLDWTTKTDAQGRFIWSSAPPEPVLLTLTRLGFTMISQREFQADTSETTVTMYPPLRVRGKVTDAGTGKPIEKFTVVQGNYYRSASRKRALSEIILERGDPWTEFNGGRYEVEFSHPQVAAVAMRVEAKGYKPATSGPFKMEAGDAVFDARLEPGVGPSGMVRSANGQPLAGAAVTLSTKSLRAQLYNGNFHAGAYPQVLTDAGGRFSLLPQTEAFRLFVDHPSGFADVDEKTLASSPNVTVHPWGRVEGLVKIGNLPAAGVQIRLSASDDRSAPDSAPPITQAQQTSTNARGHYAFERVIPTRLSVSRVYTLERSRYHLGTGCIRTITVSPERTTFVDLGGTGRPVVGRFVLPTGIKPGAVFPSFNQTLTRSRPEPPVPSNLSEEEREAWLKKWLATREGETYSNAQASIDTNVRPDGTFRIDDVPSGKYELHAQVHEPGNGVPGTFGPELANIDSEITIPEIPGGRSDAPLDLGTIKLKPFKPPGSD
jgi:Carboxypeptidase regulatory-like domain